MSTPSSQDTLAFLVGENEKISSELVSASIELTVQNEQKDRRTAELSLANKELAIQNKEKDQWARELLIANQELARLNDEMEKKAAELLIANKELEQLTSIASHDLQEPLRTISNYLQIFEEDYADKFDEQAFSHIRSINKAAKRMSALVKGLLHFSRLGRERLLCQVDIKVIVTNVIADLQTLITNSEAIIEVGEMPVLNVYEIEFGQLLQNLLTNAIKFQNDGTQPRIKIYSQEVNGKWQFAVSDNGIGIAEVHFSKVFDIFQRLHDANVYEGNGIGLANCKKIVELHHGRIWLESTLGKGTTVYFTISNL